MVKDYGYSITEKARRVVESANYHQIEAAKNYLALAKRALTVYDKEQTLNGLSVKLRLMEAQAAFDIKFNNGFNA